MRNSKLSRAVRSHVVTGKKAVVASAASKQARAVLIAVPFESFL
jgi:ribosomal protein L7Ae-like RNA K-turn-binding protein